MHIAHDGANVGVEEADRGAVVRITAVVVMVGQSTPDTKKCCVMKAGRYAFGSRAV